MTAKEDEELEGSLGALIRGGGGSGKIFDVLKMGSSLGGLDPGVGGVVKGLVMAGSWWSNERKADRVFPVLVGLYQRLERTRSEYVKKEEFLDVLEDVLRRVAEQPDPSRRESLASLLYKVMDLGRDANEVRWFARLADELPSESLRVLQATRPPITRDEWMKPANMLLAARANVLPDKIDRVLDHLANEQLIDRGKINTGPGTTGSLEYLLTPFGRDFLIFCASTSR